MAFIGWHILRVDALPGLEQQSRIKAGRKMNNHKGTSSGWSAGLRAAVLALAMMSSSVLTGPLDAGSQAGGATIEKYLTWPHYKSATALAYTLNPAVQFRASADCPSGPDRHSGWEWRTYVARETGKCYFWRQARYAYFGVRFG